jgi:hypothetical protein
LPSVPEKTGLPTITGTAQQGQTLTENHGTWTNSPTSYSYEWQRCNASGEGCAPISGATAQAYVLQSEDAGHELRVKEIAGNAGGSGSPAESAATAVVLPPVPESTSPPTITGTAQLGQTLTEAHGSWLYSPTSYTYQWQRCDSSGEGCVWISGATAQTYVPVAADLGHKLRVDETASNAGGSSDPASQATAVVGAPAQMVTSVFTSLLSSSHPALGDPPARVVLSVRSVTVKRNGVAVIPLGCPASAVGGCRGRITITIHIVEPHARRAGAARCARGCRPLAGANYEARAGQRIRVRVHIASFGRQLLTNRRSVHVTLTATSVADGQTATVTRAITLRRA